VRARDRSAFWTRVLLWLLGGLVAGLAVGVVHGLTGEPQFSAVQVLVAGFALGVVGGITGSPRIGLQGGLAPRLFEGATGLFFIARSWLVLRGRLPRRLMAFLADAHAQRGVLRQVGAVYQFRHIELQRYLADTHRRTGDSASGGPSM
jgi:hypothetical protein